MSCGISWPAVDTIVNDVGEVHEHTVAVDGVRRPLAILCMLEGRAPRGDEVALVVAH